MIKKLYFFLEIGWNKIRLFFIFLGNILSRYMTNHKVFLVILEFMFKYLSLREPSLSKSFLKAQVIITLS